jgi:hypothetical protein
MKLPTLNVDVAVNTKTMKKGIAQAQKELSTIGRQGLSIGGGGFGKIGAVSGMASGMGFGALGSAMVSAGGILMAIQAPFKVAEGILTEFAAATKEGKAAMLDFAEGRGGLRGINLVAAERLGAAAPSAEQAATMAKGMTETFLGAMMDETGKVGGLAGFVQDWAKATVDGVKAYLAFGGATLGGKGFEEAMREADIATTRSAAGAQAYLTQEEINRMAVEAEKYRKAQREQNT